MILLLMYWSINISDEKKKKNIIFVIDASSQVSLIFAAIDPQQRYPLTEHYLNSRPI